MYASDRRQFVCRRVVLLLVLLASACGQTRYGLRGDSYTREEAQAALLAKGLQMELINGPFDHELLMTAVQLPEYPNKARRREIQGTVTVRFRVEQDGTVDEARVEGNAPPELGVASLNAVRSWRFRPVTRDGHPAVAWVVTQFLFQVEQCKLVVFC